jgi:hypothetical protein
MRELGRWALAWVGTAIDPIGLTAIRVAAYSQGILLYEALKKAGVEATLQTIKGGDHGAVHQQDKLVVTEFFDKQFKKPPQLGD